MTYAVVSMFIVLDIISGLIGAIKQKTYTSRRMREGLYHKAGIVLVLVFGILIDFAQANIDLGISAHIPVSKGVRIYVIAMECSSIWENIKKINPQINVNAIKLFLQSITRGGKNEISNEKCTESKKRGK